MFKASISFYSMNKRNDNAGNESISAYNELMDIFNNGIQNVINLKELKQFFKNFSRISPVTPHFDETKIPVSLKNNPDYFKYKNEINEIIFGKIGKYEHFEFILLDRNTKSYDANFGEYSLQRNVNKLSTYNKFSLTKLSNYYKENINILIDAVQYPHCQVEEAMIILSQNSDAILTQIIIKNYKEAARIWKKIHNYGDPIRILNLLMFTKNFICFERNARYLVIKHPFNIKLRNMYLKYLEDNNSIFQLLKAYQWLCRIYFKDENLIKEYRNAIIKFGCNGENIGKFWIDTIEFERVFVSIDAARKILQKALNSETIGAKALFKYGRRFEKKYGNLESLEDVEKLIEQQKKRLFEFEKKIFTTFNQIADDDNLPFLFLNNPEKPIFQAFALPNPVLSYFFKKAPSIILYNLFSTCKFFWSHYTPIHKFYVTPWTSFNVVRFAVFIPDIELDSINIKKLILTNSMEFASEKFNLLSNLMPKIYKCHLRSLKIYGQKLTLKQYKKLTESQTVEILKLGGVIISDNNGEVATIENVLSSLCKLKFVYITNARFTNDSGANLLKIKFENKFKYFAVGLADETINIYDFKQFLEKNCEEYSEFCLIINQNINEKKLNYIIRNRGSFIIRTSTFNQLLKATTQCICNQTCMKNPFYDCIMYR